MALFVGIVGSRNYPTLDDVRRYVKALPDGTTVVSGGAKGVDSVAARAAGRRDLPVIEFRPNIARYGSPAAFHERNRAIVRFLKLNGGRLIAFSATPEITPGTASTLRYAEQFGVPAEVIVAGSEGRS